MFKHEKKLMHKVRVEKPNPQYAVLMQEQLGGCNGELKAAMQYLSQSFRAKDPVFKDLLLDIGTEELSHLEIVAECINLLNGGDVDLLADIASEQRAKVVYEYLYRQIDDKYVKETIMFLLEREEAHNALFCEALNKITHDGSNKNFGISEDSRLYFDLSKPGRYFDDPKPEPVEMKNAPGCSCKDKKAKK